MPDGTIQLLIGLALLAPAADQFVVGAARVAASMQLSAVLVGALIVGFGTSAPELLITVVAAADDSPGIAAGNLVGSNIANLTLVAAVAALLAPLAVASVTLRREVPLSALAVIAFALVLLGGLSRWEGVVMLVLFAAATFWIIHSSSRQDDVLSGETAELTAASRRLPVEWTRTALGLIGTLVGAQLVVGGSQDLAADLGISEGFVGLSMVAIGTSLPELVTGVQATRRGHVDLLVGNILGSNLFNSLIGGGALALIAPGPLPEGELKSLAIAFMVATTLVAAFLFATGRKLVRWEAAALLVAYAAMLPLVAG